MYRLVAVDLDDTLLNGNFEIGPRARRAVAQAQARGVLVTLATGRMYRSARSIARELGITAPLITYQGALVKDAAGREYAHRPVPPAWAREVIGRLQSRGYHVNVYINDNLYMRALNDAGKRYANVSRVPAHVVDDLVEILAMGPPTKVLAIAEPGEVDRLERELAPAYKGKLHVTKSKPYFLEFSHPLATKGRALAAVARWLGVPRQAVLAIGDSYNDLDMLAFAGLGAVVGNACPEARAAAGYVAAAGEDAGVAEIIERFVLGEAG
ncbi:MAG: Cof-type HAD-IIB family hydrolase [Desulfotomaculales bacterium]